MNHPEYATSSNYIQIYRRTATVLWLDTLLIRAARKTLPRTSTKSQCLPGSILVPSVFGCRLRKSSFSAPLVQSYTTRSFLLLKRDHGSISRFALKIPLPTICCIRDLSMLYQAAREPKMPAFDRFVESRVIQLGNRYR